MTISEHVSKVNTFFEINFDENKIDKTYILYHVKIKNENGICIVYTLK